MPELNQHIEFMRREVTRRQREREAAFAAYRDIHVAYVNGIGGSINVPGKPDYVWVSTWGVDGSRYQAFNKGFSLLDGTPVMVAESPQRPFRWEIIDLYTGQISGGTGGSSASYRVGIHGKNHQIPSEANPGKDPVIIYQPAVDMLKSFIFSGLIVGIRPLIYRLAQTTYTFLGTSALDLTAYVPPSASTHRYVLAYLDTLTNTAAVEPGAAIADTSDPVFPDIPGGGIPSAYWLLANGATTLSMVDNYVDARTFMSLAGSNVPEEAGQILFALTASAFTPEKPMIDETTGTIMIDETTWTIMVEG